eukprot:2738290-Alexandrium_andersonii.AAC.1
MGFGERGAGRCQAGEAEAGACQGKGGGSARARPRAAPEAQERRPIDHPASRERPSRRNPVASKATD